MSDIVEIYTDGASSGNPGPGGYGAILRYKGHEKELSKGYRKTTNNRMELLAVIEALRALKFEGLSVIIYSDSKYVVDAVEKGWVFGWQKIGFKSKKNPDLWKEFLRLYEFHKIKFKWVRGHDGHAENERCDVLATTAAQYPKYIDEYYEKHGSD